MWLPPALHGRISLKVQLLTSIMNIESSVDLMMSAMLAHATDQLEVQTAKYLANI